MNIAVVGAGKMGLPLACALAGRGARVWACDSDPERVEAIDAAECPFDEPGLAELLRETRAAGRLEATTDTAAAASQSDAVIVIVPALLTPERHADLSLLEAVSREIASALRPGTLVVYETTVPLGTTRSRFLPLLEASGLRLGQGLLLAYSPERVKSRLVLERLLTTPKVVGGADSASAERACELYLRFLGAPVVEVPSLEAAELVKLAGMAYRDLNIALANQLACYAEAAGVELPELIDVVNGNGEAHLLVPGVGVGGHCTPVYPWFLLRDAAERGVELPLTRAARALNDEQPERAVGRLETALGSLEGRRAVVLGLAFRPGVKEHTLSSAFAMVEALTRRGAVVAVHDPLYGKSELEGLGLTHGEPEGAELLLLNTAHAAYRSLDFARLAAGGLRAVFDGRGLWPPAELGRHGILTLAVGRPGP